MTGLGHATDVAVQLGLEGESPECVDVDSIPQRIGKIRENKIIQLFGRFPVIFDPDKDLIFLKGKRLRYHSNAMRIKALNKKEKVIFKQIYYSIGGGFV